MAIGFGPKRRVIPPSNLGQNLVAQRRVAEAAGRAAEKTRIAVSVDSFQSRVWLRNQRGSIQCPCSSAKLSANSNPLTPTNSPKIEVDKGEGANLREVDKAYPLEGQRNQPDLDLPVEPTEGFRSEWVDEIGRLLLGDGRRCGLCWGTGWIDGHHLWGGQRYLCCAVSTPWVEVDESSDIDIDLESPTPTMVGPGMVAWHLKESHGINLLDSFRVREGLHPAKSGWLLTLINAQHPDGIDVRSAFDLETNTHLKEEQLPTTIILILPEGVRVSHVEMVLRSEPLINLQLPNMQLTASTELVQPFIQEEFEIDPIIGWLERGSILEVPGLGGRLGAVWIVTDVTEMRTAQGVTWNIVGSCRNVQANEVLACVALEDDLLTGLIDPGLTSRGFETTGADIPAGLNGKTDESQAAVIRGIQPRHGGGESSYQNPVITFTEEVPFLPTSYMLLSMRENVEDNALFLISKYNSVILNVIDGIDIADVTGSVNANGILVVTDGIDTAVIAGSSYVIIVGSIYDEGTLLVTDNEDTDEFLGNISSPSISEIISVTDDDDTGNFNGYLVAPQGILQKWVSANVVNDGKAILSSWPKDGNWSEVGSGENGIWISNDELDTLINTIPNNSPLQNLLFYSVKVSGDGSIWYALATASNSDAKTGIYKSLDGNTWNLITSSIPDTEIYGNDFVVSFDGSNVLTYTSNSSIINYWLTTNGGNSWNKQSSIPYIGSIGLSKIVNYDNAFIVNWIAASSDLGLIITGGNSVTGITNGIYISTDKMVTITPKVVTNSNPYAGCVSANGQFLAYTNIQYLDSITCGVITSTNAGSSFINQFGAPFDANNLAICCDSTGQNVFMININELIYHSTDFGVTWNQCSVPLLNYQCISCSANGQIIIAGTLCQGLAVSFDGGLTWTIRYPECSSAYQLYYQWGNRTGIIAASENNDVALFSFEQSNVIPDDIVVIYFAMPYSGNLANPVNVNMKINNQIIFSGSIAVTTDYDFGWNAIIIGSSLDIDTLMQKYDAIAMSPVISQTNYTSWQDLPLNFLINNSVIVNGSIEDDMTGNNADIYIVFSTVVVKGINEDYQQYTWYNWYGGTISLNSSTTETPAITSASAEYDFVIS